MQSRGSLPVSLERDALSNQVLSSGGHGFFRAGMVYGRQIYRFRWLIIVVWIMALVSSLPFARQLAGVLTAGGLAVNGSDSFAVSEIMNKKLHVSPWPLLIVFHSDHTLINDPLYQKQVNTFVQQAASFQHVSSVPPPSPGKDGRTMLVTVNFALDTIDAIQQQLPAFRKLLISVGPAQATITGPPAVYQALAEISQQDAKQAELVIFPLLLIALLIIFGTIPAAVVPLVLASVTIPVALAIIYSIAVHIPTSILVSNLVPCVGIGVSIDFSLFITRRFREELARQEDVSEAIACTVATAGRAIFFSGLIVLIGFFGLFLVGLPCAYALGTAGIVVVTVVVLATLSLLPALLSILGSSINRLPIPFLSRFTLPSRGIQREKKGFWHIWAIVVMRRPLTVVAVISIVLLLLSWPLFSINIGTPFLNELPRDAQVRQSSDLIQAQYSSLNINPIYVVAQTTNASDILTSGNLTRINDLTRWLNSQAHVINVVSLTHLSALGVQTPRLLDLYKVGAYKMNPSLVQLVDHMVAGNTTLLILLSDASIDSAEGKALVNHLRANSHIAIPGLTLSVGGLQPTIMDFNDRLYGNFPLTLLFIVATTYVLLLCMFRSLLLPLKAILMNILSVGATCGILVCVFQWGYLQSLLKFTPNGTIASFVPIVLFCILFGLSMDYEVFLLSRIHEEWIRTRENRTSVALGLEKTAGVITNAALLFMIVTSAFTFTQLLSNKELGFGLTVAILLEATLIRTLLVPATMCLLGRWNWWMPKKPLWWISLSRDKSEKN